MKIERIRAIGFRGFRDLVDLPFAASFTVLDGRNGVGKSTVFDAVEYALTGAITKFGDMKASGETVADYVWWKGEGPPPSDRFVEVTFIDGDGPIQVRRTPFEEPAHEVLSRVETGMVNVGIAPASALSQLCAASIIRDENIAGLSLDLSETQRYAKLRQAIGATDADRWAERGNRLATMARKRSEIARAEVASANNAIADANRRIDEARASLAPEAAVVDANANLAALLSHEPAAPDQLLSPGREFVAMREKQEGLLTAALWSWDEYQRDASALTSSEEEIEAARAALAEAQARRAALPTMVEGPADVSTEVLVSQLHEIRTLGMHIGLLEHSCPLCSANHDEVSYAAGLAKAAETIERISLKASEYAKTAALHREAIASAELETEEATQKITALEAECNRQRRSVEAHRKLLAEVGLEANTSQGDVAELRDRYVLELERARHSLRVLGTISQNQQLEKALAQLEDARARLARAQDGAGRARRAEATAGALHDAARRAGSETLDLRLERVLPLMAELYARLRPHPIWQDIEYAVRGDLRRFLSLQVGQGLNPQFLFSSGQRRATGLAFLLSINLSLAWSRWRSILLDDPVQHVDDFRTVNLAEVLAQLVASGRQIIIAVEDPALAELLARRMPVHRSGDATRLTLGLGPAGSSTIIRHKNAFPMSPRVLAA